MTTREILKTYWGYPDFRPMQQDIIDAVLAGKDVLALLPTGGGKSLCFQVPAMAQKGLCLVISPLIALIKDQVANLKDKGIPALAIYSGMPFPEIKKTLQNAVHGNYKFLYVSPERLETALFLDCLPDLSISLLAIDEAHCISQWGYDFRPSYLNIVNLRAALPGVPVIALTASATSLVQDDICEKLSFGKMQQRFQQSFERPNLSYSVFNTTTREKKLQDILAGVKGSAIIYCKSRKRTKQVADLLVMQGIRAGYYHAGLGHEERHDKQQLWIDNKIRVMVCTNAFGMGIDKPDVRLVVHYDIPDCLENYYQEAGRAGRDGKRAYAVLLFNNKELKDLEEQPSLRFPKKEELKKIYIDLMNHLQMPAGSGEGNYAELDIAFFAKSFDLNIITVTNAIKAFEQQGLLTYNETFFKPSSLVFTITKRELEEVGELHPGMVSIIQGLLRLYEGIFDFPATIEESRLANFIKMETGKLKANLMKLHELGIVDYNPRKDKPQLLLLQNRMYADAYIFDMAGYLVRKKYFEARIAAMSTYAKTTIGCRSVQISNYFNAPPQPDCGICDNCINRKSSSTFMADFKGMTDSILGLLDHGRKSAQDLLAALPNSNKEEFWKVLNHLIAEKKIRTDREGNCYL